MPVQRFLPDVDRTRRAAGWILIVLATPPLVWLCLRVMEVGHANMTAVILFLLLGGLLALGARLALQPMEFLEIDLEDRKFNVIRKGKRTAAGALDSLGPLEVTRRTRVVNSGHDQSTIVQYVVHGAIHSGIDLYVMKSPGQARQKMEALARAWRLPCQSYGGAVRPPDALDTPLHERLRGDSAVRKAMPLAPDWGVRIEPAPMGYAMVSTFRSWAPLQLSAIVLVLALFPLGGSTYYGLTTSIWNGDLMAQILGALTGIVVLAVLGFAYLGVRDTFFPGTVRITERGVSYRGRRMRFSQIEEVTATTPIEIVGDRRILRLAETFCPPAATATVAHELQRLIVGMATSSPEQV